MKTADQKSYSWRDSFRLSRRAYALLLRTSTGPVTARLLYTVWEAVTPYAGIYLSARILAELTTSRDPAVLRNLVLMSLFSAAAIALVTALLRRWKNTGEDVQWIQQELLFSRKQMEMDFSDADDPKVRQLYDEIWQNRSGGGWGFNRVCAYAEGALSSAVSLLCGLGMTVTLFTTPVPATSPYAFLNSPLFLAGMTAVMLLIAIAPPALVTKANSYWAMASENHRLGNRLFGFYGWLGTRKARAGDIRIYRQDRFSDEYCGDKTGIFCSHGPFARLARGRVGLMGAAAGALSSAFTGTAYIFVGLKALGGAFDVGAITQYVASLTRVAANLSSLLQCLGTMRNNAPFLAAVFRYLDIPNNMYQGSLTTEKRSDRQYEVEFRNVSFRYPNTEAWALKNVSMKFRVGSRLAIVGENGSGKTTFIKLLCRLYDPQEGQILLNGIDIRKYSYRDYMEIFSAVFQDFKLLSQPLGANVAGSAHYDADRVRQALAGAGFSPRLETLPEGLDTLLYKDFAENGVEISGGEAQKIAIARALYKDSPFIILDEPTAALDPMAEAEIYSKFDDIAGDRTTIYISHRLSSCKFCDEIAVFHQGTVVQQGRHENLVADEGGKYYQLWHAQAQYYA